MSIEPKITGIYKIVNTVNGKKYVGSAVDIKRRWQAHKLRLRKNNHHSPKLQNAWNKHGESSFTFSVIEECEPIKEVLLGREQHWIDKLQACGHNGYNIGKFAGSSMLGRKHSKEAIEKISIASKNMSQESRKKQSESIKGRIISEESRARMSEAQRNRPPVSEEARTKMSESAKARAKRESENRKIYRQAMYKQEDYIKRILPIVLARILLLLYGVDTAQPTC